MHFRITSANKPGLKTNYFFLVGFRCGVEGRPEFIPLYWYLAFFSEGFRIYKKYIWLLYFITSLKLYQLILYLKTQNFSKKSCEKKNCNYCPSHASGCYNKTAGLANYQTWNLVIQFCNFQKNNYYVNLQMMGLLFKF